MPDRRKIFLLHLFVGQTGGTRYLSLSLSLYSFATSDGSAFKEPLIKAYPCQAWKDSFNENRDMKMGRSIYTVERSKAVPWNRECTYRIYIYIPLLPFSSSFLSYLQGCFIPRIKLSRIFLYLDRRHYIDSFSFHVFFSSLSNRRYYFTCIFIFVCHGARFESGIVFDKTESRQSLSWETVEKLPGCIWRKFLPKMEYRKLVDSMHKIRNVEKV